MKKFSRAAYLLNTLYYKCRIPFDCRDGLFPLLYSEFLHYIDAFFGVWWEMPGYEKIRKIRTVWGTYFFPGDLYGYLIMNPAFERLDKEHLIQQIKKYAAQKERILYCDIGAYVGDYTIGIPGKIGKARMETHAFEPDPLYFTLLRKNISINKLRRCTLHNVAAGDRNKTVISKEFVWPGHPQKEVKLRVKKIDDVFSLSYVNKFDRVVMKIDIEGHEEEALQGATRFFSSSVPMLLMIEDAVRPGIRKYLKEKGFVFAGRRSPYNSFWTRN